MFLDNYYKSMGFDSYSSSVEVLDNIPVVSFSFFPPVLIFLVVDRVGLQEIYPIDLNIL